LAKGDVEIDEIDISRFDEGKMVEYWGRAGPPRHPSPTGVVPMIVLTGG
jgi:hypothetical protein